MVMLSNVPAIPPEHTIAQLQAAFFRSFERHVFLKAVVARSLASGSAPPYLELALACICSATAILPESPDSSITFELPQAQIAADLFVTGVNLWSVMLEVDNRESRLCAAVTTVSMRPNE